MIDHKSLSRDPDTSIPYCNSRLPNTDAKCRVVSLRGLTDYTDALNLQYAAQKAVREGCLGNTLYFLEHAPVITIGRGAGATDKDLIATREELAQRSIAVLDVDRGGETTYHGPGQLVGYSIVDLNAQGRNLHRYLRALEQVVISALRDYDVAAQTISGLTGVWVGDRKIAAIGIKVSRWVSMHGFSLNIDADLAVMRRDIVPCGIADRGVVSLRELGVAASRNDLEASLAKHWSRAFGTDEAVAVATDLSREATFVINALDGGIGNFEGENS